MGQAGKRLGWRGCAAARRGVLKGGHSSGLNQHHHFAAHFFPPAWQVVARLQWRTIKPWRGTGGAGRGEFKREDVCHCLDRCKGNRTEGQIHSHLKKSVLFLKGLFEVLPFYRK